MRLKNSEIFDEYAKIAEKMGLISKAEEKVEDVYNLPLKSVKELVEEAHPETIVQGPSYDKMNGIIENVQQRQDIMSMLALKTPTGFHDNTRYISASEDLLNSTLKIALMLDNQNQEQAAKLADSITQQLYKEATPLIVLAPYLIAGAVALLGGASAYAGNHPDSQGFKNDILKTLDQLDDVKDKYPKSVATLAPFEKLLKDTITTDNDLEKELDSISNLVLQIKTETDKDKRIALSKNIASAIFSNSKDKKIEESIKKIKNLTEAIVDSTDTVKTFLETLNSGPESTVMQWLTKVKEYVVQSDVEDVLDLLEVLKASANDFNKSLDNKLVSLDNLRQIISKSGVTIDSSSASPEAKKENQKELTPFEKFLKSKNASYKTASTELKKKFNSISKIKHEIETTNLKNDHFPNYGEMIDEIFKGYLASNEIDIIENYINEIATQKAASFWNTKYNYNNLKEAEVLLANLIKNKLGKNLSEPDKQFSERFVDYKKNKNQQLAEKLWKEMSDSGDFATKWDEYISLTDYKPPTVELVNLDKWDF
jgi:tetrahydromethanopterin S-methyltransferase subunit B